MQHADNSPLEYGETVVIVDDTRTLATESGKIYVYDKNYQLMDSLLLTAEELTSGKVYVELHSDGYGKEYFVVNTEEPRD